MNDTSLMTTIKRIFLICYFIHFSQTERDTHWIWSKGCMELQSEAAFINITTKAAGPAGCFHACGNDTNHIAIQGTSCLCLEDITLMNLPSLVECMTCDGEPDLRCGNEAENYWSYYEKGRDPASEQEVVNGVPACAAAVKKQRWNRNLEVTIKPCNESLFVLCYSDVSQDCSAVHPIFRHGVAWSEAAQICRENTETIINSLALLEICENDNMIDEGIYWIAFRSVSVFFEQTTTTPPRTTSTTTSPSTTRDATTRDSKTTEAENQSRPSSTNDSIVSTTQSSFTSSPSLYSSSLLSSLALSSLSSPLSSSPSLSTSSSSSLSLSSSSSSSALSASSSTNDNITPKLSSPTSSLSSLFSVPSSISLGTTTVRTLFVKSTLVSPSLPEAASTKALAIQTKFIASPVLATSSGPVTTIPSFTSAIFNSGKGTSFSQSSASEALLTAAPRQTKNIPPTVLSTSPVPAITTSSETSITKPDTEELDHPLPSKTSTDIFTKPKRGDTSPEPNQQKTYQALSKSILDTDMKTYYSAFGASTLLLLLLIVMFLALIHRSIRKISSGYFWKTRKQKWHQYHKNLKERTTLSTIRRKDRPASWSGRESIIEELPVDDIRPQAGVRNYDYRWDESWYGHDNSEDTDESTVNMEENLTVNFRSALRANTQPYVSSLHCGRTSTGRLAGEYS